MDHETKNELLVINDSEFSEIETSLFQKTGDDLLIDLVRGYPMIYDKTLDEHKNHTIINNAWEEIATVMALPAKECQERFRRLKQYFSKERTKRELESRSGAGPSNRKSWDMYDNMLFLEKHMVRRRAFASNTQSMSSSSTASNSQTTVATILENDKENTESDERQTEEIERKVETETENECANRQKKAKLFKEPKKNKKVDPLEQSFLKMNSAIETLVHNVSLKNATTARNDDEELFGKLVASELKKKEPEERNLLKKKNLQILY